MTRPRRYNPTVLTFKTAFLQRVQEAVGDGYEHYVFGRIAASKAPALVQKFAERYLVDLDKSARHRRKAKGLGNARLVLYSPEPTLLEFVLLVTNGEHSAHLLEKLQTFSKAPLVYQELELVRLTLRGRQRPGLTWRLSTETVETWRARLHFHTAHYDKKALYQDFFSLYRTPGFAGVRRQVGELVSYWRREWRKLRGESPCPVCYPHDEFRFRALPGMKRGEDGMFWPTKGFPSVRQLPTLFYVRKQASKGDTLSRYVSWSRELLEAESGSH